MMATTARAFFNSCLDAWNAHDPKALAPCLAGDAICDDVARGRIVENRDYYNLAEMFAQELRAQD